ncbi:MAG: RNA-binding domain-containing protein [Candidatus Thorarchaeota archaeon]
MFKIVVETKLFPTEDKEKVSHSLTNILEGEIKSKQYGQDIYLFVESSKPADLQKLYDMLRQYRILDVARKQMRKGVVGNATIFYLNKQVAYVKKINFSEEEGESPLGPIRVEIEHDNIEQLIDWLAPYTKNGEEVKLVRSFP